MRPTLPRVMFDVPHDAEAQLRIFVENLSRGHVVTQIRADERLVTTDLAAKPMCEKRSNATLVLRSSRHGRPRAFWLPGVITVDKRGSISLIFGCIRSRCKVCSSAFNKNPSCARGGAEEDRGRSPSMPQREFANQKALLAYAERNALVYAWERSPAFAKRQRLLSPKEYDIVEVRRSRGMSRAMLFSQAILLAEWEANAPLREALAIKRERLRVNRAQERRARGQAAFNVRLAICDLLTKMTPKSLLQVDAFWKSLKEIATSGNMSLSDLLAVIDSGRHHGNLSSAMRLFVLNFYWEQRKPHDALAQLAQMPGAAALSSRLS